MQTKKVVASLLVVGMLSGSATPNPKTWLGVGAGGAAGLTAGLAAGAVGVAAGMIGGFFLGKHIATRACEDQLALLNQDQGSQDLVPCVTEHEKDFSHFVGQELAVQQATECIDAIKNFDAYKDLGAIKPKGLLIRGARGNGKTLLANIIAGQLDACLIPISARDLQNTVSGDIPTKLALLFEFAKKKAKEQFAILFLDDLDELLQADGEKGVHFVASQIEALSADDNMLVIGAMCGNIENVWLRRAAIETLFIDLPNHQGREAIFAHYLQGKNLDPGLIVEDVAAEWAMQLYDDRGESFAAEWYKLFVEMAATVALKEQSQFLRAEHFERAYCELEGGAARDVVRTEKEIERIAYHEAGHALVAVLTGHRVPRVSTRPRERWNGVSFALPGQEHPALKAKTDYLKRIAIILGGFCAELLVYKGEPSPGAVVDLRRANRLVSLMVTEWGMAGNVSEVWERLVASDYEMYETKIGKLAGLTSEFLQSDAAKAEFDKAHGEFIRQCMQRAAKYLATKEKELSVLAQALLEKETLLEEEVYELIGEPLSDDLVVEKPEQADLELLQ